MGGPRSIGTFAAQDIRAWGVSTDTGYTFDISDWKVRLGLKADAGSGDRNPNDGSLGTLNPLFLKLAYVNQAAVLGPSNVVDLQLALSLMPTDNFKITVGYDFLRRATTADAIYTGVGVPILGTAGQPGRFTAGQLSVDRVWQLDRHVEVELGYVHLEAAKS
ncbi:MAG: alginate export family protein [Xanthobacteraceae bacterium]|nr:alginate export family protein [Xanthobacteraceae bacterium]